MTIQDRFVELVSRCVECGLAEPESLASLGGSAPGVVDGILSRPFSWGGSLAPPEQDRLEHGPHSCKLPMFAEDVSWIALAILPME